MTSVQIIANLSQRLSHKEGIKMEKDKIVKGIKMIVEKSETSFLSEIRFLVEHFKWKFNKSSNVSTQIPKKVSAGYQKQLK